MQTLEQTIRDFPQARGRQDRVLVAMIGELEPQMNLWRKGHSALPRSYIQVHADFANADLKRVVKAGWHLWTSQMVDDGWIDGMQFVIAIVESPDGHLIKIKWSDSGLWYVKSESGGWILCGHSSAKEPPATESEPTGKAITVRERGVESKPTGIVVDTCERLARERGVDLAPLTEALASVKESIVGAAESDPLTVPAFLKR
jgi:hypothetical protein